MKLEIKSQMVLAKNLNYENPRNLLSLSGKHK